MAFGGLGVYIGLSLFTDLLCQVTEQAADDPTAAFRQTAREPKSLPTLDGGNLGPPYLGLRACIYIYIYVHTYIYICMYSCA